VRNIFDWSMVSGVKSLAYQSPLHIDETNQNRVDIACATSFLEFNKCHDSLVALATMLHREVFFRGQHQPVPSYECKI